ncbi:ABC transporter permease [Paeniglutamicibacter cryotolerans]|uniref:Transport permease protein n=1 Tax=Paeniglutamicibacter cryotolerans TaxID=670079 RepID=A0A839QRX2_9MICC|nr:ABC transporter permease [Paeniglutamicibacter cryotolerans]MBB2997425.1 teichoic acid transport system permease protein [Paeniglutamicibacter cryotolerans]
MSAAEYAARNNLARVGARPPLMTYLRQAWERRDFAYELARSRVQAMNERNRLGMLWIVLKPTMNALMYGFIFGVLQGGRRPEDFPVFVVIGVFLFEFFSASMTDGARAITGNSALVQSLSFPRITLPISTVLKQFMMLVPMLGVMAVYCMILGTMPRWSWLLIIPLVAIFSVFNTGIALICARLTVHVRDLTQLLPLVNRMLFYTSGVLFSVDRVLNAFPGLVVIFDYHPIYQTLSIARGVMMDGAEYAYPPIYWLSLSIIAIVTLIAGVVFFWKAEERYGRAN